MEEVTLKIIGLECSALEAFKYVATSESEPPYVVINGKKYLIVSASREDKKDKK